MADIPDNDQPIQIEGARTRKPVSESLVQQIGGAINYIIKKNLQVEEFTSSGFFTVPDAVSNIILYGCGGGGGGGRGATSGGSGIAGSGGGAGALPLTVLVPVTPGDIIAVTVGAGGVGATVANTQGGSGGDTLFGSAVVFPGAPGGFPGQEVSPVGAGHVTGFSSRPPALFSGSGSGGIGGANPGGTPGPGQSGSSSIFASGGSPGSYNPVGLAWGGPGGGGGASLGPGGSGGDGGVFNSGLGGSGANALATSYGAGGGGAGGGGGLRPSGVGGNGGPGVLYVFYFS